MNEKSGTIEDLDEINSELEEDEEEDHFDPNWNRAMAESLYQDTRANLNSFF